MCLWDQNTGHVHRWKQSPEYFQRNFFLRIYLPEVFFAKISKPMSLTRSSTPAALRRRLPSKFMLSWRRIVERCVIVGQKCAKPDSKYLLQHFLKSTVDRAEWGLLVSLKSKPLFRAIQHDDADILNDFSSLNQKLSALKLSSREDKSGGGNRSRIAWFAYFCNRTLFPYFQHSLLITSARFKDWGYGSEFRQNASSAYDR